MSAERVIQAAIYAALTGDGTYMALVSGVYDEFPPEGAPTFPYTLLGEATEELEATHDKDGYAHTITIHDWTDVEAKLGLQQIRERRQVLLHRVRLTVAGFNLTKARQEFATVMRQWDPVLTKHLLHQVTRYRLESLEA
jgi:hypothetical protein